jgi:hypothetical protein
MCGFKPGDEVVCVNGANTLGSLIDGQVYIVSDIGVLKGCVLWPELNGLPGVKLRGVSSDRIDGNGFYRAERFRKVERKNDSLSIEAFLTIKPGFEEKDAFPVKKRERV